MGKDSKKKQYKDKEGQSMANLDTGKGTNVESEQITAASNGDDDDFKEALAALDALSMQLDDRERALAVREQTVLEAERKLERDFDIERTNFANELIHKRAEAERDIAAKSEERLKGVFAEQEANYAHKQELINKREAELSNYAEALHKKESELKQQAAELAEREQEIRDRDARSRERADERIRDIERDVDARVSERKASIDAEADEIRMENQRLRKSLVSQQALLASYDELKNRLGGEAPESVLLQLNSKTEEIRRLQEELATRPTTELLQRYDEISQKTTQYKAQISELQDRLERASQGERETSQLKFQLQEAIERADNNERLKEMHEITAKQAIAELDKMRAEFDRLYGTPAGQEERRLEIEMPFIAKESVQAITDDYAPNEIKWLDGIYNACEEYGLHFSRRMIDAFHTSLKTAEWAPITVLAGVSGTGKSELPRLYSHFGGLYFAPISVQPNWDSQESMLGFFNSIDNRFDAQPILNFLAQTQKNWDPQGYPGLRDSMSIVLLDEMNLAHPELYFAEFLSKLESRRGAREHDIPMLDVKIGAGMPPYKLPLNRNVLWVGTMNQDETTKSLSDKVLDRSIVMHFPRPTELKRRKKLKPLNNSNRGKTLSTRSWSEWCQMSSIFDEEEIAPYKRFVEEMNTYLGSAGRALGHRVWQSIEYYMSNYPNVLASEGDKARRNQAMHTAFEDQLVQKVMPKLRGIDTRGKSKSECLDKIRAQLTVGVNGQEFNLVEDFDLSCELGYGQFIWQSANYLKEDEVSSEAAGE